MNQTCAVQASGLRSPPKPRWVSTRATLLRAIVDWHLQPARKVGRNRRKLVKAAPVPRQTAAESDCLDLALLSNQICPRIRDTRNAKFQTAAAKAS